MSHSRTKTSVLLSPPGIKKKQNNKPNFRRSKAENAHKREGCLNLAVLLFQRRQSLRGGSSLCCRRRRQKASTKGISAPLNPDSGFNTSLTKINMWFEQIAALDAVVLRKRRERQREREKKKIHTGWSAIEYRLYASLKPLSLLAPTLWSSNINSKDN